MFRVTNLLISPKKVSRVARASKVTSFFRYYAGKSPSDRRYTRTHEWIKVEKGVGTIGITAHAAGALGDVVFVELPTVGAEFVAGDSFGALESVKAASDIYIPVAGTVTEANTALEDSPDLINKSPYETGWISKIKVSDESEISKLLTNEQYESTLDKDE